MLKIYHVLLLAVIINRYSGTLAQYDRPQAALPGEYYEEEDEDDYMPVSPCNVVRPGDPDLTTYDVISSYRFDEYHYKFEGVQQIAGSTGYQTAYHIEDYSNTTIESIQAFPRGVPNEFSFECTFRVPDRQPPNEWYLFELTDYKYESQMSVTINPIINSIDFSLPKYDGSLQTVSFEEIEIFDRSWHKVMFGVTNDAVRLWVDCKPVPDRSGNLQAPLDVRSPIDSTEGAFSVARDCQTRTTVPIDLQWMIFSCDAEKPKRTDCREIQYAVAPKELTRPDPKFQFPYRPENRPLPPQYEEETTFPPPDFSFATTSTRRPWFMSTTPAALQQPEESTCPEQCPRGPPGPPGPPGLQGYPGPAGPPARSNGQYDNRLQKGERGEVGLSGLPGRDGVKGERGRDGIPGRDGLDGAPGPQGAPGIINGQDFSTLTVAGEKGSMGLKGDKGDSGDTGLPGYPGITGMPGVKGSPGVPGEMGLRGRPGEPGPSGEKGDMGAPGLPGIMGYPGTQGLTGPEGPPGPPGPTGNSDTIYSEARTIEERQIREICMEVVRDYISEISATLAGPPGPPGRRGVGRPGAPGAAGLQGEPGQSGPQGERGYPGIPGMPGANGERGARGAEGEKGNRGEDGIGREGPMGPPGPPGPEGRGIDGMPGRQGDRGDTGRPGEPGARGTPGQPGVCPDCTAYNAAYAYPLLLAQQQQSNKGPQNYYNKGPQNYYNKGP